MEAGVETDMLMTLVIELGLTWRLSDAGTRTLQIYKKRSKN